MKNIDKLGLAGEIVLGIGAFGLLIGIVGLEGCIKQEPAEVTVEETTEADVPTTYNCRGKVIYVEGNRVTVVDEHAMEWDFVQYEGSYKEGEILTLTFDTNGTISVYDDKIINAWAE